MWSFLLQRRPAHKAGLRFVQDFAVAGRGATRYIISMPVRFAIRAAACGALALVLAAAPAAADACRAESFEGNRYTVCSFDLRETDLRIFWRDADDKPYLTFSNLAAELATNGLALFFGMNGGMFNEDQSPVGLLVEGGKELKAANTRRGPGNFHMKPNGVFYIDGKRAGVMETDAFLKKRPRAKYATQSGPMLVINGKIHPRFVGSSDSLKRRNGVGISDANHVHFAISEGAVNFHSFARFFRDRLGCANALFLDGSISGLYAPEMKRDDGWPPFGPIIGAVSRR
jgi:uncharacterized protein YigE (DUF2233 family)